MSESPINIVFGLFPEITQLDFTGPAQVLARSALVDFVRTQARGLPMP